MRQKRIYLNAKMVSKVKEIHEIFVSTLENEYQNAVHSIKHIFVHFKLELSMRHSLRGIYYNPGLENRDTNKCDRPE